MKKTNIKPRRYCICWNSKWLSIILVAWSFLGWFQKCLCSSCSAISRKTLRLFRHVLPHMAPSKEEYFNFPAHSTRSFYDRSSWPEWGEVLSFLTKLHDHAVQKLEEDFQISMPFDAGTDWKAIISPSVYGSRHTSDSKRLPCVYLAASK